jgi:hypothetical protein
MLRSKQRFVCKKCGRVFYEYLPDCIGADTAMFILHPLCKRCRTKGGLRKNMTKIF